MNEKKPPTLKKRGKKHSPPKHLQTAFIRCRVCGPNSDPGRWKPGKTSPGCRMSAHLQLTPHLNAVAAHHPITLINLQWLLVQHHF